MSTFLDIVRSWRAVIFSFCCSKSLPFCEELRLAFKKASVLGVHSLWNLDRIIKKKRPCARVNALRKLPFLAFWTDSVGPLLMFYTSWNTIMNKTSKRSDGARSYCKRSWFGVFNACCFVDSQCLKLVLTILNDISSSNSDGVEYPASNLSCVLKMGKVHFTSERNVL